MALEIKNVILLGGTSVLGKRFVEYITTVDSPFNITITTRSATPPSWLPSTPNFKITKVDFTSHESLVSALRGQDAAVALLGLEILHLEPQIVEAAIEAGVKLFIPSGIGPDPSRKTNPRLDKLLELPMPWISIKVANTEFLEKKVEEGKIKVISVQNGPFFDWGLAIGFLGINFQEHKATIVNGGNITAYAITTKKLGEAIAKLLLNPTPWINKAVLLTTIAYKQNDILRLIQEKTGEKWTVEETTSARAIELGKQLAPGNSLVGAVVAGSGLLYHDSDEYYSRGTSNDAEALGLGWEDLEEVVTGVLAELKAASK